MHRGVSPALHLRQQAQDIAADQPGDLGLVQAALQQPGHVMRQMDRGIERRLGTGVPVGSQAHMIDADRVDQLERAGIVTPGRAGRHNGPGRCASMRAGTPLPPDTAMNERITNLLAQMARLEDELRTAVHDQESRMFFEIRGRRVEFERSVKAGHRKLKTNFFRWLVTNRPQNLITGPIIYAMVVPLLMLDLCVSFYQWACFPIYGIARVRRADYIVYDRHQLGYLNFIEKFHCTYCEYANGLIAYLREIVARTEQYFCPIKHAHAVLGTHTRYNRFLDYGDADQYEARLEAFRKALARPD